MATVTNYDSLALLWAEAAMPKMKEFLDSANAMLTFAERPQDGCWVPTWDGPWVPPPSKKQLRKWAKEEKQKRRKRTALRKRIEKLEQKLWSI